MKKPRFTSRKRRIAATSIAAFGAATAGGFLATGSLDADVINSGAGNGFSIGTATFYAGVDFNSDGQVDLFLYNGGNFFAVNDPNIASGNNGPIMGGTTNGFYFPAQFQYSSMIGAASNGAPFIGWQGYTIGGSISTDPWGVFANGVATGYIGVEFYSQPGGVGNHWFGWVQVQLNEGGTYDVLDWAYDDSGAPIHAGDRGVVIPEPTTGALGLLALGAVALRNRRRKVA
jgi:MYXO-CTERM domain-containing protein